MEISWLSHPLSYIHSKLNSVFLKIMAAMILLSLIILTVMPFLLNKLQDATTEIVIDSLSKEQEYLFRVIQRNTKESIIISAKPFLLKQESISNEEDIKAWEGILLGFGNSLNRQYGLIRILTFDLSGTLVHDYAIDDSIPQFDSQQDNVKKIITQCLETESSSERVVASLKNHPYLGLCLLSEDRDEEVSNAHLLIIDFKKILTKMKKATDTDIVIQLGTSLIHDNLSMELVDGLIHKVKTLVVNDSEGKHHHYVIAKSELAMGDIFSTYNKSNRLYFFIDSEKIHTSFQLITRDLMYIILVIILFSLVILLSAIHYLLRPMKGVNKIAHAISNGDYDVRLNHQSADEIGTVMNTIDNMLDEIQKNYITIKNEKENAEAAEQAISDLRQKNELILNSAGEGIFGLDMNGNITFINPSAAKMVGWETDELIGKSPHHILHHTRPDGTPYSAEECHIFSALRDERVNEIYDDIFWRQDGSSLPVEYISTPMKDENDQIIGAVVTFRDITERKKAEIALENSRATIIQQEKMASIGQLAGGIAHDFNNILSVITGYSELALAEMKEDDPVREQLVTIHRAGEKAAGLTKELLAFSRKQPMEMKVVSVRSVIDSISKILNPLIGENIRIHTRHGKDLKNIQADKTQLEQVLLNLTVNARDAMPDGGELSVQTSNVVFSREFSIGNEQVKPGAYVMLAVRDTGTGMSREVRERIFEPFFSTKSVGKGTGMGLATVFGIVTQHSGYITVNSRDGEGTVFKIYLPATDREIEEDQTVSEEVLTGDETILVVDDEPLLITLVLEMLKPLGYKVLTATNGQEALQVCRDHGGPIELLLTDVIMPGMNGKELSDAVHGERPGIETVFMSGYTDDAVAHHGVLDEGVVLLNKPLRRVELAQKLRKVLGKRIPSRGKPVQEKLAGVNILLADDNEDIRRLIQVYLKDVDCTVDTAENGSIAVEKYLFAEYDIVLMDMQMPVMNGLEATEAIRKAGEGKASPPTPIIALTGNASQEEIERCLAAGCSSHLAKPIKKESLLNALAHVMAAADVEEDKKEEKVGGEERGRFVAHIEPDLKDLIPEYLAERQSDINRIQEAIGKQDYETVRILGHTLKGSGGGYGFDPITEYGMEIENAAKKENHDDIEKYTNQLSDYIEHVEIIYTEH